MSADVLSEVLSTLELSSRPWFRAELNGEFAVAVPDATGDDGGTIRFHVATGGTCTLAVGDARPVVFAAGDLILVPHGAAHVIADQPGREPAPLAELIASADLKGIGPLVQGEGSDPTVVVCGEFCFGHSALHPFLTSLPPLLHVAGDEARSFGWVEQVLRHIEREAGLRPTGHLEVIRRLSEILLVEVLRARAGRGEPGVEFGALAALADPQLGRVLEALHAEVETDWSLERMARIAGQSRTSFVERFRERVGVPPMKYLAAWRMQKARSLLARTPWPVGEVARRVGYGSESAFNRTFREQFGTPPGAYRKRLASA